MSEIIDRAMTPTLKNKHIIVGITGGIAAYKSAELVRLFVKAGADVRVVMTEAAKEFITPLTLQALSGNPVSDSLLDANAEMGMGHIELARWADFLIVAPATADFIARMHAGMANDLLTTLCLATTAQIALAPAMNEKMWLNASTQHNLNDLTQRLPDLLIFGPSAGEQACGDVGYGRMLEASELANLSTNALLPKELAGKRVIITAGPTQEAIDPVRYLSNNSSGKMGFALANAAADSGAEVCLIAGPVALTASNKVTQINVISALDMLNVAIEQIELGCDIFIGTAAIADYRPINVADHKLKKDSTGSSLSIELTENPDIIATVARHSQRPGRVIAFAAETQHLQSYAQNKLNKKNVDAVVANDVSRVDIGFGSDKNEILWVTHQQCVPFGPATKPEVAKFILNHILAMDSSHDA